MARTTREGWYARLPGWYRPAVRAALLLTLYLLSLAAGLAAYVKYCELTLHSVDPRLSRYTLIRDLFHRPAFDDLIVALGREKREPGFGAVWDIDLANIFDRAIYIPTEMFGETRYRRRPNIKIVDFVVWTGLSRVILNTVKTPAVDQALRKCRPLLCVSFETDAFGFKKTDIATAGTDETVMFLGDSFTEGLHVRSPDTFVSLFGHGLQQAGLAVVPVNAGVSGYGALEEAWMAENYAVPANAKVLIENLYLNDVDGNPGLVMADRVPPGSYRTMFSYLGQLKRFCADRDLALIVSVIPDKQQIRKRPRATVFQERLKRWCARSGVPFLDPLPHLRRVGGEANYFSWDPHLNEEGHRNYAAFLLAQTLPLLRARFGDHPRHGRLEGALPPSPRQGQSRAVTAILSSP